LIVMVSEREQLESVIRGLESQRGLLGDGFVDAGIAPLRARLTALKEQGSAAAVTPEQTLRLVTIVFLDVVGSTQLSQHLDPEDVHAVMDGALARCTDVVAAHHGKVLQYAGDNLLAAFGADEAREDDAERAVRCGLALLAEGRALGEEVRQHHRQSGFGVRVGIHTGTVLLGGGVDGDASIRGIAVNVAARMEQTAPPGGLRISHDTWLQVRGAFDVEPQAPLAVKGVDTPVTTYLVQRARPLAFRTPGRGIEGVPTRMVGRDAQLATLQDALADVSTQGRLVMVTVVAEAGLGKSRLLLEFERRLDAASADLRILRGRATPQTPGQPFGLLRDTLAWQLRIADGERAADARHKVEAGIVPYFVADDGAELAQAHAHVLGHLIGLDFGDSPHVAGIRDDPRQLRNRAFHTAAQLLRRVAGTGGAAVVLLLEDLHWADDGSLEFLKYLLDANSDVRMLVVALARPVLFERRSDLATVGVPHAHRRIMLGVLDEGQGRELVGELLKRLPDVPPALLELVVNRAEGNPFYIEELVKMLIERGAIATYGSQWTLHPQRLLQTEIPPTLIGLLQARLDSLPRHERQALQEASVIGHVFWDQALAELDAQAPAALPALQRRELVLPHEGDAAPDDLREFAFNHKILHDVTYDTVLKRRRRVLHARAADWLASRSPARASEWLGAAAEHYALAGNAAQAAEFFIRAAEHARSRHAHETALAHTTRALAQLDAVDAAIAPQDRLAQRWRLVVVREFVLGLLGRRDEQRPALDEMRRLADALQDDQARALAARRRSQFGLRTGDYALQEAAARDAMVFAVRAGADESRLEAQRLLADALGAQGRLDEGQALARAGLAEARTLGLRRVEGVFLNALSLMAGLQDDLVAGLELDSQDLVIWRALGDKHGESVALANVGADWLWFGRLEQARHYLEQALRLCRAIGARQTEIGPLVDLALLAMWQGDAQHALVVATQAIELASALQAPDFEADAWCTRGEAELALGRLQAAQTAFERAESLATAIGHGRRHHALAGRARVALARGDMANAMEHVETLLARRNSGETWLGADARLVLWSCHLVLAQAGDPRAADLLASAQTALQARAATISDAALRASFLASVPHHRAIADACAMASPMR
jgi:class 3 adenylate cyclase/tetratricopeptide (TPR) repeat protein